MLAETPTFKIWGPTIQFDNIEGTPYAGGYFRVRFKFTEEFPAAPPKCALLYISLFHSPNSCPQVGLRLKYFTQMFQAPAKSVLTHWRRTGNHNMASVTFWWQSNASSYIPTLNLLWMRKPENFSSRITRVTVVVLGWLRVCTRRRVSGLSNSTIPLLLNHLPLLLPRPLSPCQRHQWLPLLLLPQFPALSRPQTPHLFIPQFHLLWYPLLVSYTNLLHQLLGHIRVRLPLPQRRKAPGKRMNAFLHPPLSL